MFTDEDTNVQQEQPRREFETERSSTCTSSGSFKFYREFDGTTSAKLSQTSKTGHQGILVTPRVMMKVVVVMQ